MRITAVRAWFNQAVHRGWGVARKATHALSKRVRVDPKGVSRGVGVGHDESRFGGDNSRVWLQGDDESRVQERRRSRAWAQWLDEARERILAIFEHTVFERVPRLRRFVRRLLGGSAPPRTAPGPVARRPTGPLGAHPVAGNSRDRAYIQRRMHHAHVAEHAGLRASIAKARKSDRSSGGAVDGVEADEDD